MEGQIRLLKDALETRSGVTVACNHIILALLGLEYGELVNCRRTLVGNRLAKLDSLWSDGVFLGTKAASGEILIATAAGVFRTRTVKRKAHERR